MTVSSAHWAFRVDTGVAMEQVSDVLDLAGVPHDGLSEVADVVTVWFADRPDEDPPLAGRWERVEQADWAEDWKAGLDPVQVGRVRIVPPWLADTDSGPAGSAPDVVLLIEPGLAFGTGHHETTTACLRTLQEVGVEGRRVLDVGTGTGVLAMAARALGATHVQAVDTDPQAVDVARDNITRNGLDGIDLAVGSCEVAAPADVVVANIITDLLLAIAADLVAAVDDGGVLIASGVAVDRVGEAVEAFAAAGITTTPTPGREWAVLVGRRT